MNVVENEVKELVKKELDGANKKFPLFASAHEGYAVILEEVEEAEDEMKSVKESCKELWQDTKLDVVEWQIIDAKKVKENAHKLICEAIQVAAMAQKFIDSLEAE